MEDSTTLAKQPAAETNGVAAFFVQYGSYLVFMISLVAMLGSLYFSEIVGFMPCELCWYQRIAMYPIVLISLVGIITKDDFLPNYVLPLSIIGMGISIYHYSLQLGLIGDPNSCTGVSCSARYINYAGFITIPFLALTAFILITIVMGLAKWGTKQLEA